MPSQELDFVQPKAGGYLYLKWLTREIETCWRLFVERKIFAPYLCLIQSSGYGKTRTLLELAKANLDTYKVIFWNLSSLGSYPTNHFTLHQSLINIGKIRNEKEAVASMTQFLNQWRALASDSNHRTSTWVNSCFESSNPLLEPGIISELLEPASSSTGEFLLIIDEASALVRMPALYLSHANLTRSVFELLRKVLSSVSAKLGIICILADTVSSISNFAAELRKERSDHLRAAVVNQIYRPIWFLPSVDILAGSGDSTAQFLEYGSLLRLGRPLWYSMSREYSTSITMLEFALQKLGNRLGVDEELFFISLWFVRVTLHIQSAISFEMVAKTMATCTWISEDRSTCLVSHNSEPILAEAAAWYLSEEYGSHKQGWYQNALVPLREALKRADISMGDLGELIAQIILLKAFDSCVKISRPQFLANISAYPVTVKQFLNRLVPDDCLNSIKSDPMLDDESVLVYFSHFTEIDFVPNKDTLTKLITRGSALKVKVNQRGADLLIPVFKNGVVFGILMIQVKNKELDKNRTTNIAKLHVERVFGVDSDLCELPTIGIYIAMREQLSSSAAVFEIIPPQPPSKEVINQRWEQGIKNPYLNKVPSVVKKENRCDFQYLRLDTLNILADCKFKSRDECIAFLSRKPRDSIQPTFVLSVPLLENHYSWIPEGWQKDFQIILGTQLPIRGPVLAFSAPDSFTQFDSIHSGKTRSLLESKYKKNKLK
jgi:hypothetical protein